MMGIETVAPRFYDYGCSIPQCISYWNVLLQRQKYGKIKLKLDNENYKDENYET